MNKHGLVGAILVLVAGCTSVLGIDSAPALDERPDCLEWKCKEGQCGYVAGKQGDPCSNGTGQCDGLGTCLAKLGGTCEHGEECAFGVCTENHCCDRVCDSDTEECADDGRCKLKNGQLSNDKGACASGIVADGRCCAGACDNTCMACNVKDKVGTCAPIDKDKPDDESAVGTCNQNGATCDGNGVCNRKEGLPCNLDSECRTNHCIDGVCCENACIGLCMACSNAETGGIDGKCVAALPGHDPRSQCPYGACNGAEACIGDKGQKCDADGDCLSGNCVDGFCCDTKCGGTCEACSNAVKGQGPDGTCGPIVLGQDPATECEAGSCGGDGNCKFDIGHACTTPSECLSNSCQGGYCTGPSCLNLAVTCGNKSNESCCASAIVPGGKYNRVRNPAYEATVSTFRLDIFEVTVGRFRQFVNAYPTSKPIVGAGADPQIPNSGWQNGWALPSDPSVLTSKLKQCGSASTWRDFPGDNAIENRPINCVSWEVAFAFCAWDGGWLPTEAEWNRAAAGENGYYYPWISYNQEANWQNAVFGCGGDLTCDINDILQVGLRPQGKGSWNHMDLGGSVTEWTLDYYGQLQVPCLNCAQLFDQGAGAHVVRGGSWKSPRTSNYVVIEMLNSTRGTINSSQLAEAGLRCARNP